MIDCTENCIYYTNKNKSIKKKCKKRKRFFRLLIIFIIILSIFFYSKYVVFNVVFNYCKNYTVSYSSDSVNEAVLSVFYAKEYEDLIKIEKNSNGEITLITTDYYKVNLLNKEIAVNTKKILKEKLDKGIPMPILAFSGLTFLSGYGIKINYKSLTVNSVLSNYRDNFVSVGINQTLHSIYVDVTCVVGLDFPLESRETSVKTSVLLSETVLVGKIPEIYLSK